MDIVVVVHPIDPAAHPSSPGWRWAVTVGAAAFDDPTRCANAGWAPDRSAALAEGDRHGASVTQAFRLIGIAANYSTPVELDFDPIPAGRDYLNTLG